MRTLSLILVALAVASTCAAQRRARIGPTVSSISIESGSGLSDGFTSFGGSLALLSGDDGEFGVGVSRYGDLSNNSCVRQMTFIGLESNYYPIGAKGVAPYASTAVGLARVLDQDPTLALLGCNTGAQTSNELGLGFGLGVRFNFRQAERGPARGSFLPGPEQRHQGARGARQRVIRVRESEQEDAVVERHARAGGRSADTPQRASRRPRSDGRRALPP